MAPNSTTNAPSTFKPYEHKNQHYVPAFWQRRFTGPNGQLYKKKNGAISTANPDKEMSEDWIYTTFDAKGFPSNAIEHGSSRIEARAASAMRKLDSPNTVGSIDDQLELRFFFAFSACRHPDTMSSGHRRAKELARCLATAHALSVDDFVSRLTGFGVDPNQSRVMHEELRSVPYAKLQEELEEVIHMAPTDSQLPQQIAVSYETVFQVLVALAHHNVEILEAPPSHDFILGDTPFPPALGNSFCTPISAKLALRWTPGSVEKFPTWTRRPASNQEVLDSNRTQFDNSLQTVIGPSKTSLA